MKQNTLKYLLLSTILSLSAQNTTASASASAAAAYAEVDEGVPGQEGQTVRVSMFYKGEDAAPNCGTLTGFRLKLPNGSVKTVRRTDENVRLSIDDKL